MNKKIIFLILLSLTNLTYTSFIKDLFSKKDNIKSNLFYKIDFPKDIQEIILSYASYRPIWSIPIGLLNQFNDAIFLSDNLIATADESLDIKIWNIRQKKCTQFLKDQSVSEFEKIFCFTWKLTKISNNRLLSFDNSQVIRLWDLTDYKLIKQLGYTPDSCTGCLQLPDNKIITTNISNGITFWDLEKGTKNNFASVALLLLQIFMIILYMPWGVSAGLQ